MSELSRYEALLRVCDMACAHAAATGADTRADFYELLGAALHDDCPEQSAAAASLARKMRNAAGDREQFLASLRMPPPQPPRPPTGDGDGSQSLL